MENEIWKDVVGYEGIYIVSNIGNVISIKKNKLLKPVLMKNGYLSHHLSKEGNSKRIFAHILVAMAFLGHVPCGYSKVIDHIDNNRGNNNLKNLQIVTHRLNSSKDSINKSGFICVHQREKSWQSFFSYKSKKYSLGNYKTKEEASLKYKEALENLDNLSENMFIDYLKSCVRKKYSAQSGVTFDKSKNKWIARKKVDGGFKFLGLFLTEEDACNAIFKNKLYNVI
jgi:hypothetical protein